MEEKKKPDKHAVAMGRKRWLGVPPEERSRLAKAAVEARQAKRRASQDAVAAADVDAQKDETPDHP